MLLGVRVELSCYGFGTLFEVGFQDRALPLVWDAVRYALFFERAKPVGTDPYVFISTRRSPAHI